MRRRDLVRAAVCTYIGAIVLAVLSAVIQAKVLM